jgi:hypothetical protein
MVASKNEIAIILIGAGAAVATSASYFFLLPYKSYVKGDDYLNRFEERLRSAFIYNDDDEKDEDSQEEEEEEDDDDENEEDINDVEQNQRDENPVKSDKNKTLSATHGRKKCLQSRILWELLSLLNYAQLGAKHQEIERNDWLSIVNKLELTIEEILSLDMFDNVQRTTLMLFRDKRFHLIDLFDENECLIGFCLKHNIKVLFNNALINNNVDEIFRTTIGTEDIFYFVLFCDQFGIGCQLCASLRLSPWFLCAIDVASRMLYLIVVGIVCVNDYGATYGSDYSMSILHSSWSRYEAFAAFMLFSSILHEVGEVWDVHWSWKLYFEDEWNIMDTMSYVCIGGIVVYFEMYSRSVLCRKSITESAGYSRSH